MVSPRIGQEFIIVASSAACAWTPWVIISVYAKAAKVNFYKWDSFSVSVTLLIEVSEF